MKLRKETIINNIKVTPKQLEEADKRAKENSKKWVRFDDKPKPTSDAEGE